MKIFYLLSFLFVFFIFGCSSIQIKNKESNLNDSLLKTTVLNENNTSEVLEEENEEGVSSVEEEENKEYLNMSGKDVQIALKNAGYYKGKVDSIIGNKTRDAIRRFQIDNDLMADSIAGKRTKKKLFSYLNPDLKEKIDKEILID